MHLAVVFIFLRRTNRFTTIDVFCHKKSPPPVPEETTPPNAKKVSAEKVPKTVAAVAPVSMSPAPPPNQPKQLKKRTKPVVSTASANLFAAFIKNCNKKQKTE